MASYRVLNSNLSSPLIKMYYFDLRFSSVISEPSDFRNSVSARIVCFLIISFLDI